MTIGNEMPSIQETAEFSPSPEDAQRTTTESQMKLEKELFRVPRHRKYKPADFYEKPVSLREGWWRSTIKETPNPGSYGSPNYLEELMSKPNTYKFRSEGRSRNPQPQILYGAAALPGAYNIDDFVSLMNKRQTTYNFKSTGRSAQSFVDFGKDKDIDISPNKYGVEKYGAITNEYKHCGLWQFKSKMQRFPTLHFQPKDGPAPGAYDQETRIGSTPAVSSSFKSKTPRFSTSHTRTPGPGMYDKALVSSTLPPTVAKTGRQYGIFYSSVYQP